MVPPAACPPAACSGLLQGAIEFVVEEEGEMYVTKTLSPGSVIGELSFFFGMRQSESARSRLNSPGASLFVLHHKVRSAPQHAPAPLRWRCHARWADGAAD